MIFTVFFFLNFYFIYFLFNVIFNMVIFESIFLLFICYSLHLTLFSLFLPSFGVIEYFIILFIYLFIWLCLVLVVACWLLSCGMRTLSSSMHVGQFPDQGLNPCPLHWQADSFFFLAGGFLTTEPPGKSLYLCFDILFVSYFRT